MCLKVEFLAGTSIQDCIDESVLKCQMFDLAYVKFDFNGVSVSVRSKTDIDTAVEEIMEALKQNKTFVVV